MHMAIDLCENGSFHWHLQVGLREKLTESFLFSLVNPHGLRPTTMSTFSLIAAWDQQNKFDSKAGTTARAIETLMGQYFD